MTLINTKLFAPRGHNKTVVRHHLQRQLERGLAVPVTLVCAPAGYGKSNLLASWAQQGRLSFGWLQLEPADAHPLRLLHYLTAALRRARPQALANTWGLLQAPGNKDLQAISLSLVNEACDLDRDVVLILDDYHSLDAPACDDLLSWIIDYSPPQLHWFIATREDPSLPLARWRGKGLLNELRAAQLCFQPKEAQAFFHTCMGLDLPQSAVTALCTRTEGWIAALQLAALSLRHQDDIEGKISAFTGSNRFVTDYLMTEVLAGLSPELNRFVARTVHLPRFNSDLCSAVTGQANSAQLLQQLEQNNLFLVALDDRRQWYRYHHLFADVVASQQVSTGSSRQQSLIRAAHWYHDNALPMEAIECARDSADRELLAQLIELHWPAMRSRHNERDFLQWMQQLPQSLIEQRPVLCGYYGLALLSEQFELGQHYLHRAEQWLGGDHDDAASVHNLAAAATVPGLVNLGRAYISGAMGDQDTALAAVQSALQQLPAQDHLWRGAASALLGIYQWTCGDLPQAASTLQQACVQMQATDDISAQVSTRFLLASVLLTQGRLRATTRELDTVLARLDSLGVYPEGSADILVLRADCHLEANELDLAQQLLERAETLGPGAQLAESRHHLPRVRAELALARGDYANALAELDTMETLQSHSPTPELVSADSLRALAAIRCQQVTDAHPWAHQLAKSLQDQTQPMDIGLEQALALWVLGLYHLAQAKTDRAAQASAKAGHLAQAQIPLTRLAHWLDGAGDNYLAIDIYLAQADLALLQQDKSRALTLFERALGLAQAEGFVLKILHSDCGQQLLPEVHASAYPKLYPVLKQALQSTPSANGPQVLQEPLSEREQQVLQQLDSNLSGPEIADQLFISLNTFRTHSKNIYAKLGVNTRRSAVSAARSLGLLTA